MSLEPWWAYYRTFGGGDRHTLYLQRWIMAMAPFEPLPAGDRASLMTSPDPTLIMTAAGRAPDTTELL